jgi:hypothetical protein
MTLPPAMVLGTALLIGPVQKPGGSGTDVAEGAAALGADPKGTAVAGLALVGADPSFATGDGTVVPAATSPGQPAEVVVPIHQIAATTLARNPLRA